MNHMFAHRMSQTRRSFIREILKVTENPNVISFAGGLPNPRFFAARELADACTAVLKEDAENVLQYSTTEGYLPLREYIAARYLRKRGLKVDRDEILITNGSQQGLDLIAKVFLNQGDRVILERPGYLGAIQAFGMYEAVFEPVPLMDDGIDMVLLRRVFERAGVKLYHAVLNFQNPSGVTYSLQKRIALADVFRQADAVLIEDDAYGELRFKGDELPSIRHFLEDNLILLGSFSKIVAPGLRLGWICAGPDVMDRLVVAKQASDLHSNYLSQRVVYRYLLDNDIDEHILQIRQAYGRQRDLMVSMIEECFPRQVKFTRPDGGMFLWVTLPENVSAMRLLELAAKENVAFVPGGAFYVDGGGNNTLRLNFSNCDRERIEKGISRLAKAVETVMAEASP